VKSITVTDQPLSGRRFLGLGVETDGVIFGQANRDLGVDDADLARIEARLRLLRPALSRMFVDVKTFNPSLDGRTFDWDHPHVACLLRMLRILRELGTSVNLVLFQPHAEAHDVQLRATEAMVCLLERLRGHEGIDAVRWLTIFNEPDGAYPHDSPLMRRIFGDKRVDGERTWATYLELTRHADGLLRARGLYPAIRLAVPDTVYGAQVRRERMRLASEAWRGEDVTFSYHNYNPEYPEFYAAASPDFLYDGIGREAAGFRSLVGPAAPLVMWEFNVAGQGFGSHFPGSDRHGCHVLETLDTGPELAGKIMTAANGGVDGFCVWCLCDMNYGHASNVGIMRFGMWRFRWESWSIRPYAHYFAALCRAFRPGAALRRVDGVDAGDAMLPDVNAMAARDAEGRLVVSVLNTSCDPRRVSVTLPVSGAGVIQRVHPAVLTPELELSGPPATPVAAGNGVLALALEGRELVTWRSSDAAR
jgi:hypothetical protein